MTNLMKISHKIYYSWYHWNPTPFTVNGTEGNLEAPGRTTPRVLVNGHAEPALPGLMGSTAQEESEPVATENDHIVMVIEI